MAALLDCTMLSRHISPETTVERLRYLSKLHAGSSHVMRMLYCVTDRKEAHNRQQELLLATARPQKLLRIAWRELDRLCS
jgi:hypothetical protein